jgi:hypothetical protein
MPVGVDHLDAVVHRFGSRGARWLGGRRATLNLSRIAAAKLKQRRNRDSSIDRIGAYRCPLFVRAAQMN